MPTVECDRRDCEHHGIDNCTAKRVKLVKGQCTKYEPRGSTALNHEPVRQGRRNGVLK
ncbi:MAG: hypothetical protein H6Q72_4136 [Firmicutes bacterium]|nr:hypothetical protein [Bacillota bacterium]